MHVNCPFIFHMLKYGLFDDVFPTFCDGKWLFVCLRHSFFNTHISFSLVMGEVVSKYFMGVNLYIT